MRNLLIATVVVTGLSGQAPAQNVSLSVDATVNAGNPHVAGTMSTYTITVSNEGPADALNVQLSTTVPAGTTFQSFSSPGGWTCSAPPTITCTTPTLTPSSAVFTFMVNVPRATAQGTLITLTANVTTTSPDPNQNDNTVTLITPVVWQSSLSVSKTAPASAVAGAPITYTLNVTNGGPSDAADVTLNDALPAAFVIDSITAPGWTCTPGAIVTCTMPQFGTSATVTLQGHTPPSTPAQTLTDNADVSASTEPNTHTASASTVLTTSADLSVTKSAGGPLVPGTDVTYTLVVSNAGPSDAASVALADPLPPTLTFVSIAAPGWTCVTSNCTRAALAPGASTITLVVHVAPATPPGTTITNTVTVTSTTFDPTTPNTASASATTPLPAGRIPAMSHVVLIALALMLAALAMRR